MSSPAEPPGSESGNDPADVGLLSPVSAGTAGERLTGDAAFVRAMVRAESALLRALATTRLAPVHDAATLVEAVEVDARTLALAAVEGGNPVIPLVRLLRDAVGTRLGEDAAAAVHRGATSQDVLDTAVALVAAEVGAQVGADLARLGSSLARLADDSRDVPLVARTLTQQALPSTLGFRAAGWLAGVHEAVLQLRSALPLPASLGGPVGTLAEYGERGPDVLEAFARELGLSVPVTSWHVRRTPVLGLATGLAAVVETCGKVAADVLVMAQTEVAEATEGTAGPSSAMAHKANPARSTLVMSAARRAPSLLATVVGAGAAQQERPAGDWHAEWPTLRELMRLAAAAAERTADLVAGLRFDHDAMTRNLDLLLDRTGHDRDWVVGQNRHVGVWVDRVLRQHEEVFR